MLSKHYLRLCYEPYLELSEVSALARRVWVERETRNVSPAA